MRETRKKRILTVMLATAVIITMCFAGDQLTASAATSNKPGTPKITNATATQTSVKLTWSKAKKADGYRVYKYNRKKYVKIKTLKARTYTVKSLKANTTYKFKVRAYNKVKSKIYYGSLSKVRSVKTEKESTVMPVKASLSIDFTVNSDKTATFKATVTSGTAPFTYQWYKGGTAIIGATSETYTTAKLTKSDNGTKYTCRVTNPAGYTEASGSVTLDYSKPVSVADQSTATGSKVTFYAVTSDNTWQYKYQWYKKSIEDTKFVYIDGATSETYSPGTVMMHNNDTQYKCVVTDSSSNTASATGKLTVTGATEVGSWNIGSANGTTNYTGSNGTSDVVATLYSDGELAVTGTGDTVVFYSPEAPWCYDPYKAQVKSSTIASTVKPTNMQYWYFECSNLTEAPAIPASVENMKATFSNCTSLTNAPDLTGCTSLTSMFGTFSGCTSLTDMSSYIIPASVTNMQETFNNCTKLTKAPAMPASVEDMWMTFSGCTALATGPSVIPAGVRNMISTFQDCKALTGTMQINASPLNYSFCFNGASTNTGASLTVYGHVTNDSIVDAIVNTKSGTSNISYGGLK
jgi:hypothetical protein